MRIRETLKLPQKINDTTQAALVISSIALILALVAVVASTTHRGGQH